LLSPARMSEAAQALLVEKDLEERALASRVLAAAGWQVRETTSAAECLEVLGRGGDFVVILDLGLDGRELLGSIASAHPDTPAVVVTDADDVGIATDAMRRGAWDYVVKRADRSHLNGLPHVLARALERQRLVRERNHYRREMEALAVALRGTTDGVAILAPLGRIAFVNRAFAVALKRPESEIVGRLLADFIRASAEDLALDDVLAAVAAQGRWSGEVQTRGGDPPDAVWEVTLTPIGSLEPAVGEGSVVGIFRDVSEKHALEQLRADFLSMITHDIKVPLTVILGYTEMLTDPEPPPGEIPPDILARIRESGETIHGLVANFLDLSRIEAGRMTLDLRPFDVGEMLSHAVEQYDSTARRKGITLSLAMDPIRRPLVADESQLKRVVANLLANAIKFTASGGVTISATARNGRVEIGFRDTGRGIPADELPHLFEKYRRVREAKRTEGTGLGLFIARTIVVAHGGEIHVESTPGVGSTFTVLLP
jgi:signal transduction histidine kinase